MATAPSNAPPHSIEPALKPWERITWTKAQEQIIYRDWAFAFMFHQRPDIAARYYDKALNLKVNDPVALHFRSICERNMANCGAALNDAKLATELEPYEPRNCQAIADAFHDLNEFENAKIELHNGRRKFYGSVVDEFQHRLDVIDKNLNNSLNDSLSPFLRKHEDLIAGIAKEIQLSKFPDERPLWKKLQSENKCDVLSLLERETKFLSPLEIARRERTFVVFNQTYMKRAWKDVIFMNRLQNDRRWSSPLFKETTPLMRDLIKTKYGMVKKFIRMLHARSPMYNQWIYNSPHKKLQKQQHEQYLNFLQYRTRRDMMVALRKVKEFSKTGPIVEFAQYVEHITGEYVVQKTQRIMPWKFEFLNEVYNIFGLALVERFRKKVTFNNTEVPRVQLFKVLFIFADAKDRTANFIFGNRASYLAVTGHNNFTTYRQFVARLERRMHFARYSIEKCYLWHGMAAANFLQARYEACCELARKGIKESQFCNGTIWAFLCSMLIVRSHAAMKKIELCKESLLDAFSWATVLKDEKLMDFIESIQSINDIYIDIKKKTQSRDTLRKRKSFAVNNDELIDESRLTSGELSE